MAQAIQKGSADHDAYLATLPESSDTAAESVKPPEPPVVDKSETKTDK